MTDEERVERLRQENVHLRKSIANSDRDYWYAQSCGLSLTKEEKRALVSVVQESYTARCPAWREAPSDTAGVRIRQAPLLSRATDGLADEDGYTR